MKDQTHIDVANGQTTTEHQVSNEWPSPQWTIAPLRLENVVLLNAEPNTIFTCLTDPVQMCSVFSWMHDIHVDNSNAAAPNGLGAKRICHFGNGLVLEELIVGWEPPRRYAYYGIEESHPFGMLGHVGIIECFPDKNGMTLLWKHYFNHLNPAAMLVQLSASAQLAIDSLVERFNET